MEDFVTTQRDIFIYESEILPHADEILLPPPTQHLHSTSNNQQPQLHPSQRNLIPQIYFATHNINGIRIDSTKLEHLLTYTAEHNIDILILTETNLSSRAAKFTDTLPRGYIGFWTGSDDKIKGSGVAILIAEHLAKYVHVVDTTSVQHYIVKVTLCFKGCYLLIYGLYYPPADRITQNNIIKYFR